MKIQSLLQKLPYVGQAEGERLTYYVFEANHAYLVVSASSRGGLSVNVVDQETPDVIPAGSAAGASPGRYWFKKGAGPIFSVTTSLHSTRCIRWSPSAARRS
jgi:hypothetical protein